MDPPDLDARLAEITALASGGDVVRRIDLIEQTLASLDCGRWTALCAGLTGELAKSLAISPAGDPAANVERAIASFEATLEVFTRDDRPQDWAVVQRYLGDLYRRRAAGEAAAN